MKELNRRDFIKGALGLGAVSAISAVTGISAFAEKSDGALYTPGTYTSAARGRDSLVTVQVTFDETHITDVVIDAAGETPSIGGAASDVLIEQIIKAQGSAIDGVSGASQTSDAVRQAVADCIYQASGGAIEAGGAVAVADNTNPPIDGNIHADWLGEAPDISESDIVETIDTEVVVVGAGNAGLMTAARDAVGGAKVVVIEKTISSQTERHWIGAIGTKEQEEAGTVIDKNKVVAELCKYASHRCDERLIRLWANNSGEAVDWYADQVKKYYPDVYLHHEWDIGEGDHDTFYVPATMHNFQDDIPEHDYSQATAEYGLPALTKLFLDNGGDLRYSTSLVKLEQNDEGRVTGIIAQNSDGYIRINASKGVALCCGGYAYNKEMLATLNPDAYNCTVEADATVNDVGDGIKAAMWIGADKDPDPTAMIFDRGLIMPGQIPDGDWTKSGLFHMGSQPWLKVNLKGERFCNESVPYDFILHAAYMEPRHLYHSIYDSSWMDSVAQFQQIGCARIIPSKSGGKLQIFGPESETGLLMTMEQIGFIQKADTIEELAEKMQVPVDTFVETVKRYNELCEKGEDEDFGKEPYRMIALDKPPFYSALQGGSLLCTLDGLRINTKMQVLDKSGEPIEGLYAAGDCSGGFFAHNYPEYIVGVAVGRTLTEGYLLGAELAK